jgi:(S)-3,5-dihydroxyphenylglycine transaminase
MTPKHVPDSLLEFLNASAGSRSDVVSFAAGMPDSACINDFAIDGMIRAFMDSRIGADEQGTSLELRQYGPTRGVITPHIQRYLENDHEISLGEDRIIVTNGAQEALSLLTWALLDSKEECLLVPDPCFPGAHEAARQLGIEVIGFRCVADAVDRSGLERAVAEIASRGKRPGALYINPTYGNPLGVNLQPSDRAYLNDFALQHDFWIFEDDPYRSFFYEGEPTPPLAALPNNARTLFIGSFSKSISPSLRVGFVAAPGTDRGFIDYLSAAKSTLSLHTSQVCQAIVGGMLHECDYSLRQRCRQGTRLYKRKRDELAEALRAAAARYNGLSRATWSTPIGGFFTTLELPRPFVRQDLLTLRDEFGVLVTPMSEFSLSGAYTNAIRLAFSALPLEKIGLGVDRLGAYLSRSM